MLPCASEGALDAPAGPPSASASATSVSLALSSSLALATSGRPRLLSPLPPLPPGATVVLGGISRSSKSRQRDAVPLLGDVLPFLFSSKNKSAERKQIIIALVPHIVRFKNENDT